MRKYTEPSMDVRNLDLEDVIATSSTTSEDELPPDRG